MEDYIETTDDTIQFETPSIGVEIAKAFALSAASVAGMMAGFVAVGAIGAGYDHWKAQRAAKKEAKKSEQK